MLNDENKERRQKECERLWQMFVPISGQADTVQGELLRAIVKLEDECLRNGNGNWDMGHRLLTNFLHKYLRDCKVFDGETIIQIETDIANIRAYGSGKKTPTFEANEEDTFDRVTDRVVEWCQHHPEPIRHESNPKLKR